MSRPRILSEPVAKYPTCSATTSSTIPALAAIVRVRIAGESSRTLIRSDVSNIKQQASFVVDCGVRGVAISAALGLLALQGFLC